MTDQPPVWTRHCPQCGAAMQKAKALDPWICLKCNWRGATLPVQMFTIHSENCADP